VQVNCEPSPAVMSIDEAIAADSFHPQYDRTLERGNIDAAFASAEVAAVVQGDVRMGGQEHFYLEPHCNYVQPVESDEFLLVASTQVCSLPHHPLWWSLLLEHTNVLCILWLWS
jgi:xanthine dehydrogenase/oxidase